MCMGSNVGADSKYSPGDVTSHSTHIVFGQIPVQIRSEFSLLAGKSPSKELVRRDQKASQTLENTDLLK